MAVVQSAGSSDDVADQKTDSSEPASGKRPHAGHLSVWRATTAKQMVDRFFTFVKRKYTNSPIPNDSDEFDQSVRRIYFNLPIPEDDLDDQGNLKTPYPKNKIRTAKYTPLSFIPKNLWWQFHNIANIYFLFIIILNFFPIFGANNPALNAVPLIFILVVTAIKDAIEDWRRTVSDTELNNSPVHRLVDWKNVNSSEDNVSAWRRFKKLCTRTVISVYRKMKSFRHRKSIKNDEDNGRRVSLATHRESIYSQDNAYGTDGERGPDENTIRMTSVTPSSPKPPLHNQDSILDAPEKFTNESADLNRKMSGNIINQGKQTPGEARFKREHWKSIQVGDFVRIYDGDQIPADIAVISSSDLDGTCYLETKNLDGETNLKAREALHCGRQVRHSRDCEKAEFIMESERANPNLFAFNGAVRWEQRTSHDGPTQEMVEPVTINNMLLRGCTLRNTEWVLGIVVFTGTQTKIMLNSGITPSKRPNIAKNLNKNALYNFGILVIMCIISGFINGFAWGVTDGSLTFFEYGSYGGSPAVEGLIVFWAAMILFQNLIPIALYISCDIMRVFQTIFIHFDRYMYYDRLEMACIPKTWNISDDLGQIEYIFSDKTGTLTQNVMEFKKCTINGISYGEAYTEAKLGMQKRRQGDISAMEDAAKTRHKIAEDRFMMLQMLRNTYDNPYLKDEELTFVAPNLVSDLSGSSGAMQQHAVENFIVALALCNTVIAELTAGDPPQIQYKAQSPDEAALVAMARDCGFTLLGRKRDEICLNVMGQEQRHTVLKELEFNSTRKRMSTILRMPDGTIRLFCKGADSVIYPRLARGQRQNEELRRTTTDHLEIFAQEGLRTLVIAERVLTEEEYRVWNESYTLAAQTLLKRDEKMEEAANIIEQELVLLGGTAIEDRLQDGVPETISLLADAGIKLWVLTGDKVETAINIGFSCNLLDNDMEMVVFEVASDQPTVAVAELERHLKAFGINGTQEELIAARKDHSPPAGRHALIIDGEALKLMLEDENRQKFLLLCKQCKAVLCCRVSPAQKAAVVRMVKRGLNVMALSIGDGANDVAMIQEADIGVGIAGEEGRQAVMSSDYAIGQFRFLQRLVLVHGRWDYRRLGEATANFFYKNLVWTFALFWYSIYNNFDISYIVDYTYIVLINVGFTALPVIFMGILDQDVDDKVSLAVPWLYMRGIKQQEWSQPKFWLYMSDGFYQSLICFFMPYLLYLHGTFQGENGLDIADRPRMGVLIASAAVISSNTYILLNTYRWDWLTVAINAFSSLLIFFWTGVYSSAKASYQFYKSAPQVYGALAFWAALLVTVAICLLPRLFIKAIQKVFFPRDVDIIREQVSLGMFKDLKSSSEPTLPPDPAEATGGIVRTSREASDMPSPPVEPTARA